MLFNPSLASSSALTWVLLRPRVAQEAEVRQPSEGGRTAQRGRQSRGVRDQVAVQAQKLRENAVELRINDALRQHSLHR
jgi:hypothetical protein